MKWLREADAGIEINGWTEGSQGVNWDSGTDARFSQRRYYSVVKKV